MNPWEAALSAISGWEFVLWIVGAFVALGAVVKLWPFIRNAVQIVDALVQLPGFIRESKEHQQDLTRTVGEIKHQVLPNGGESMRDAVNRVEKKLTDHIENTEKR